MTRTSNSLRNIKTSLFLKLAALLINFVTRRIFIDTLSVAYLGLNGTFSNILSLLSLAELGVGSAITFSLYKPLAENDNELTLSILALYKKLYTIIGILVLIIGVSLTPFLPYLIKDLPDLPNIELIYILFVLNSAISYFFVYKQSLINADQKQYIIVKYNYISSMACALLQCVFLYLTHDFIVYLCLAIGCGIVNNALLASKADRLYPFITSKDVKPLPASTKSEITRNVSAMMAHKLGSVVVNGTDNLLIAYFVGAISVGLYSNYLMITLGLTSVYAMIFNSITASVGNLNVSESKEYTMTVFKRIDFFVQWLSGFSAISIFVLSNHFIASVWLKSGYTLDLSIVLVIALNFYVTLMRRGVLTFREAMGLYWYDRHKPIAESLINLAASIILAKSYGILGILLGTFISTVTTCLWIEPCVLYKYGFASSVRPYFKGYLLNTAVTLIAGYATWRICGLLPSEGLPAFLAKAAICAVLPNLAFLLVYMKRPELKHYFMLFKGIVCKKKNI